MSQLGGTLARWFAASDAHLLEVFPDLSNFDAGKRHLGFMACAAREPADHDPTGVVAHTMGSLDCKERP